jgi:hypothetical protein
MILDATLLFSENQAVTATAISENVIQFPANGIVPYEAAAIARNLGAGDHIPLLIQVTEAFATLTSLTITIETSAAAGLTSATVLASSGAIPVASLIAGYRPTFTRVLPDGLLLPFLGLRYTVGGSNATAGKITAALGTEVNT